MKAKLVNETIEKFLNEAIKIKGHVYKPIKFGENVIYVGDEGILGKNDVFIPWNVIEKLKK